MHVASVLFFISTSPKRGCLDVGARQLDGVSRRRCHLTHLFVAGRFTEPSRGRLSALSALARQVALVTSALAMRRITSCDIRTMTWK